MGLLYTRKYQNSGKLLYEPTPYVAESTSVPTTVIQEPLAGKELEKYKANEKAKAEQERVANLTWQDMYKNGKPLPKNHPDRLAFYSTMKKNQPKFVGVTDEYADKLREINEKIENPDIIDRLTELGKAPGRYMANPLRILGDIEHQIYGSTGLYNTVDAKKR
jgi:hypothetical protein